MKQLYPFGKLNLHLFQPLLKNFINLLLQNLKENQKENLNAKRHYKANKKTWNANSATYYIHRKAKTSTATKRLHQKEIYTNTNEFKKRGKKFKILNSSKNKIPLYRHKIQHFCFTHKQKKEISIHLPPIIRKIIHRNIII